MSFGVGASKHGDAFDYAAVFKEADEALYRAKRSGRDRVCLSEPRAIAATVPAFA
jgi:PleD family two-component response regulator